MAVLKKADAPKGPKPKVSKIKGMGDAGTGKVKPVDVKKIKGLK